MDALELEFTRAELSVSRDVLLPVYYGDNGEDPVLLSHRYTADFVVNGKILLAVKAEGDTGRMEDYMLLTLLHAAQMQLAILIQFKDRKVQINRVCRYSRYLNSRNIKQDEEATKNVVLTGTRVPD
jgi:GxxExxY protein